MKKVLMCLLASTLWLTAPVAAMADMNYDFSDTFEPFVRWPFHVNNVEVVGEFPDADHLYHVTESIENVADKLSSIFQKNQQIGGTFYIIGISKQLSGEYMLLFGRRNEHFQAMISPENGGSVIKVPAMPVSYISGVYDIAAYGYTMPDGTAVSIDKFDEE